MGMDAKRINYDNSGEGSCVDKEPNIDAVRFLKLLKYSDESLQNRCTNHIKL
jgi:hypothetical protein